MDWREEGAGKMGDAGRKEAFYSKKDSQVLFLKIESSIPIQAARRHTVGNG